MRITRTHTVAELPVSRETHAEVKRLLEDAGYDHAISSDGVGDIIDMHGIAITVDPGSAVPAVQAKRIAACLCSLNPQLTEEEALAQAEILLDVWDSMRLPPDGTHTVCRMVNGRCVICGGT